MSKKTPTASQQQLEELNQELMAVQEREKRILADYQNLLKRNQTDRVQLYRFAGQDLIEQLLTPLSHLSLAAGEIKDDGLNMVVKDLWRVLTDAGLTEINPMGEEFNLDTMEVVEAEGEGQTVKKVVKPGYMLHDKVLQHAKVIVG